MIKKSKSLNNLSISSIREQLRLEHQTQQQQQQQLKQQQQLPKNRQKLRSEQGLIPLACIGIGAVISGDFYGWNFGLAGGFGGLLISLIIVTFMYIGISLSLAELSSMYPSAEGAFKFSKEAFGPYAGCLCGISETLEYVLLVPVVLTAQGDHLMILFGINENNDAIKIGFWALLCIIYSILHLWGPNPTFKSNTILTFGTVLILFIYWCGCIYIISCDNINTIIDRMFNIEPNEIYYGSSIFLPNGFYGIFTSLTYASWFFVAIEELPITAEDAIKPKIIVPKAIKWSIIILTVSAFFTLCLSVSVPGGSHNISLTGQPLYRSLISGLMNKCVNIKTNTDCNNSDNCIWNNDELSCYDIQLTNNVLIWDIIINFGALISLFTSCHSIIYAAGRQLMSLTRNGTIHSFTKFNVISNSTPRYALTFVIVLGFIIATLTYIIGKGVNFLLSISVAAASLSYIFSMLSFITLRFKRKLDERIYKSPIGIFGAGYAATISLIIFLSFFIDVAINSGLYELCAVLITFFIIYGAAPG
eukprot:286457_1